MGQFVDGVFESGDKYVARISGGGTCPSNLSKSLETVLTFVCVAEHKDEMEPTLTVEDCFVQITWMTSKVCPVRVS